MDSEYCPEAMDTDINGESEPSTPLATGSYVSARKNRCSRGVFTFMDSITVKRVGLERDEYTKTWTVGEARERLAFNKTNPHTFVEYLFCPENDPQLAAPGKLYLDFDRLMGKEPPSAQVVAVIVAEVRSKVQILVDRLKRPETNLSFKLATRHGWSEKHQEHKISIRPFILGVAVRYTDIPMLIRCVEQEDFWDPSVYKPSEQLLASINGCKGRIGGVYDRRVLSPEDPEDDPLDYVVQQIEPHWMFLELPRGYIANRMNPITGVEEALDTVRSGEPACTSASASTLHKPEQNVPSPRTCCAAS